MTNKIYPGGGAVECAKKTPLVDLLRSMPKSERGIVEHDEFSTSYFPIGRMCHDAADEIEALRKRLDAYSWEAENTALRAELEQVKAERDHYKDETERIRGIYEMDAADWVVEVSQKEAALGEIKVWLDNKTIELTTLKQKIAALEPVSHIYTGEGDTLKQIPLYSLEGIKE